MGLCFLKESMPDARAQVTTWGREYLHIYLSESIGLCFLKESMARCTGPARMLRMVCGTWNTIQGTNRI
jgi:hypothetical protein